MSYLTSCRTTIDLGSQETKKDLENIKIGCRQTLVPSLSFHNNFGHFKLTLVTAAKNYVEVDITSFLVLSNFA